MMLALLLLLLAFASNVVGQVELSGDVLVFAEKDLTLFERFNLTSGGPSAVSLILTRENLLVVVEGNANGSNVTEVEWTLTVSDEEPIVQEPAAVGSDGSFMLVSDTTDFVSAPHGGTNSFTVTVLGSETSKSAELYAISDFQSLLPLISLILLAIISKNVYIAMFFGCWIGSLIIEQGDITNSFKALLDKHIIPSVTDPFNFRTICFTLFLGGFIAMLNKAGGQQGLTQFISKFATSPRKTMFACVCCGIGLFFDDYSSVLILGNSFKTLTDQFHISREKLAFVVDATSAPIASVAPISSWIAFELSLIQPELEKIVSSSKFESRNNLEGAYPFFINTIPSRYYPFFIVAVQIALILARSDFGPMLFAERRAVMSLRTDGGAGKVSSLGAEDFSMPAPDTPRKAYNFLIPLSFFIISLLVSMVNIGTANIRAANEANPDGEQIHLIVREIFGLTDSFSSLVYTTLGASLFATIFFLVQMKQAGKLLPPSFSSLFKAVDCRSAKPSEMYELEEKNAEQVDLLLDDKEEPTDPDDLALEEKEEQNVEEDEKTAEPRPLLYFSESIEVWIHGFKELVPAVLILCLAFSIKSIVTGCATDRFITDIVLHSDFSAELLPTIIFVISAILSFATGTSYGTMSIMFPLVSFATFEKSQGDITLLTVALSSIMSGAVFGDHCSPISDTTILSSIGTGCKIGAHVITQLPYALWAAFFVVLLGTLPTGYGAPSGLMFVVGMLAVALATVLVGAPIVTADGNVDVFSQMWYKLTDKEYVENHKKQMVKFAALHPEKVDKNASSLIISTVTGWCSKSGAEK